MKYTFWDFIKIWWIQFGPEYIDLLCPLFEIQIGYNIKDPMLDIIQDRVTVRFGNYWPIYPYSLLFKYKLEKVYKTITLRERFNAL